MTEFKIEDFPETVQQLADWAVGILKIDTHVEWTAQVEVLRWDGQIIFKQGDFKWVIPYGAGDTIVSFMNQIFSVWSKEHPEAKAAWYNR